MKKNFAIIAACLLLSACGSGQTIFFWEQENIGPSKFVKDHNACLAKADYFPWSLPAWPPGNPRQKELRFDNDSSNGIWANFVPYRGAQEVYVNSLQDDDYMLASVYKRCMEKKGYKERRPRIVNRQVLPD